MEILKKLLIILFSILANADLDYDEYEYTPLQTKCKINEEVSLIFLRESVKRECICKDGVYHCRTKHPYIGYENFRTRVQKWIKANYDPFCVMHTQELIVKGWSCLCLKKKIWWCTKMPKRNESVSFRN